MTYKITQLNESAKFLKIKVCDVESVNIHTGEPLHQRLELLDRKDSVGVLIYHEDKQLFTWVEQFRIGVATKQENGSSVEPVAGLIEPGQTPEEAAIREAFEETKCHIRNLEKVSSFFMCPGVSNEKMHLFFAVTKEQALYSLGGLEEENEQIKILHWTNAQTQKAFEDGLLNNAHAQLLWQYVQLKHPELTVQKELMSNLDI